MPRKKGRGNKKYQHLKVEKKWQERWEKEDLYKVDIKNPKDPFYNLWMFPYPSGEGLHAGHVFASTGSDIYGRFIRMRDKDVFQPIGYDSFGIHSENFAIKTGEHPKTMLERTTKNFERQLKNVGHGYDWSRTVTTSEIGYYCFTQWLFVQMFKAGLAYRDKADVNWCPSCKTVLSDEQVITGACERCNTRVEIKKLEQWFFRITDYAERLLENLGKIDWPTRIKAAQTNWIGKKHGATIKFRIAGKKKNYIEVFTTRPDTLYGATYLALSPYSKYVKKVTAKKQKEKVSKYVKTHQRPSEPDGKNEKTGVFTGGYVVSPATGKKIPIFVADYVVEGYAKGAIMGVPGHDKRDWEFAKEHGLEIKEVVAGGDIKKDAHEGEGKVVNSGNWDGLNVPKDIKKVIFDLEKKGWGEKQTSYHLRDWLISRQRYWGPPISMIYCEKCAKQGKSYFDGKKSGLLQKDQEDWKHAGWFPVDEKDLPVELPYLEEYKPEGKGGGPLAGHPEFYKTKCPVCGGQAKRETDVSDTFLDSSWYFLRYPSVGAKSSKKIPFDTDITKTWLPVDLYFGGAEHAVLHLMYARFVTMVLFDLEKIEFEEPFPKFFAHGLLIKDGAKMSKSRGNVVSPDEYIEKFGADSLRLYLMFLGPMSASADFRDEGIEGMRRFVERVWDLYINHKDIVLVKQEDANDVIVKMHQTIKKVTEDIQEFSYNTAISNIMEFVNLLRDIAAGDGVKRAKKGSVECVEWNEALAVLAKLLAPFAPHITEELWVKVLGQEFSVHNSAWPKYNPKLISKTKVTVAVQVNGKLRGTILMDREDGMNKKRTISEAKSQKNVKKWIKDKKIKNTFFVPGKIVNFVTK